MRLIKTFTKTLLTILTLIFFLSGCSLFVLQSNLAPGEYTPKSLLIVVDSSKVEETSDSIGVYRKDLENEGISSDLVSIAPDADCSELKAVLQEYSSSIDGAFFIGDVPPAFYEQQAFGQYEVFPTDIYYMDTDSVWTDADGNGYFESHSELEADIYTSRLPGSAEEINSYLTKLNNYRKGSAETPVYDGAFIFKDDDWQNNYRNNDFFLDSLYNSVEFYQDSDDTEKQDYISRLSSEGSEYVYQWVHAQPSALFFDTGDSYQVLKTDDISENNIKGNFYNLFDCQAARFTVKNLAQSYLVDTDSCIAVMGSTKTGGVYYPVEFHKSIGLGACWGASYKSWYNTEGSSDDLWFLGIIIMGDPAVKPYNASGVDISGGSRSASTLIPVSQEEKDEMYLKLMNFSTDNLQ